MASREALSRGPAAPELPPKTRVRCLGPRMPEHTLMSTGPHHRICRECQRLMDSEARRHSTHRLANPDITHTA